MTPNFQRPFDSILNVSEPEEIDCAYHHLSEQIKHWTNSDVHDYSLELAERLLELFGPIINAWDYAGRSEIDVTDDLTLEMKRHIIRFIGFNG